MLHVRFPNMLHVRFPSMLCSFVILAQILFLLSLEEWLAYGASSDLAEFGHIGCLYIEVTWPGFELGTVRYHTTTLATSQPQGAQIEQF